VRPHPASEVPLRRFTIALCAALAAACLLTAPGWAGTCGTGSYSYAGIGSKTFVSGVAAAITPTVASTVWGGHVSGWIGVGGVAQGPDGMDEWMQIGVTANPGDTTSRIYYEIARPSRKPIYRELSHRVRVGEQHRFAVLELAQRPGWWRVWLDGSPVSTAMFLPASHARWTAQMVGESAGGDASGVCNQYAFAFGNVSLAGTQVGSWGPVSQFELFQDPSYRLVRNSASSFVARSVATPTRVPVSTP
jgi:hypothetical protein